MATDLHAALREAITTRLALAQRTKGEWSGVWRWQEGFGDKCNDPTCEYGSLIDEDGDGVLVLMSVHGYETRRDWQGAEHIALHDPADAIRRYEADLKRLERHAAVYDNAAQRLGIALPTDQRWVCRGCGWNWPCVEVTDLAAVYPEVTP